MSFRRRISDFERDNCPSDDEYKQSHAKRVQPNYKRLFTVDIPLIPKELLKIPFNRTIINSVAYRRRGVYFHYLAMYAYWSLRYKSNSESVRHTLKFWHRMWNKLSARCFRIAQIKHRTDKCVFTNDDQYQAEFNAYEDFYELCIFKGIRFTTRLPSGYKYLSTNVK